MNLVPNEMPFPPDPDGASVGSLGRAADHSPAPAVAGDAAPLIDKLKQRPVEDPFLQASDYRHALFVERLNRRLARIANALLFFAIGALTQAVFLYAIINTGGQ